MIAEQELKKLEKQPGYVSMILQYIASPNVTNNIFRLTASVMLKNLVKKDWDVGLILKGEDRELIKSHIVDLMLRLDSKSQEVFSEVIMIISEYDFYKNWTSLLPVSIFGSFLTICL